MTLQQLKYAIAVAEKSSISEAAKSLFISQPTLSSAIKELESEINITIFVRTSKGINTSPEGEEFLGYARQVVEQANLLESKYTKGKVSKSRFNVSTQHYSFAVNAFVDILKSRGFDEYEFTLRETRTYEIINDVKTLKSQIGILYLSEFNESVIKKLLEENRLAFYELFTAKPHIFVSRANELAKRKSVRTEELEDYPRLSFEQGEYNSFYYAEEMFSALEHRKCIKVSDRATLFNLLIGMDGYTVCTGIISEELNGDNIVAVPIETDEVIRVGYILHKGVGRTEIVEEYIEALKRYV
ncbi:MAG: LysR family transcriptional regulator [Firmicutes bacterium]|nr:LysR family transcriptional regulator [Bacillota bacterium]